MANQRDEYIETIRGLACILIVEFHAYWFLYSYSGSTFFNNSHSLWFNLNEFGRVIRLPVFTFIAGYVYALRPIQRDGRLKFIQRKFERIVLPCLVLSPLLFVFPKLLRFDSTFYARDVFNSLISPIGPYWYLYSLFWIYLFLLPGELVGWLTSLRALILWILGTSLLVVLFKMSPESKFLGIQGGFYLLPFFLLGIACVRQAKWFQHPVVQYASALAFVLLVGVYSSQLSTLGKERYSATSLLIGQLLLLFLLRCKLKSKVLTYLARYSMPIYLFHYHLISLLGKVLVSFVANSWICISLIIIWSILGSIGFFTIAEFFCFYLERRNMPVLARYVMYIVGGKITRSSY